MENVFVLFKFQTMVVDADKIGAVVTFLHSMRNKRFIFLPPFPISAVVPCNRRRQSVRMKPDSQQ